MERSTFLAKVLGLYLVIVTSAMFLEMGNFKDYIQALAVEQSTLFFMGFFVLVLGLLMVVSHNVWEWSWRLIITVISWLVLLKGAYLLFCPISVGSMSLVYVESAYLMYITAGIYFVLGLILCYFGFIRKT